MGTKTIGLDDEAYERLQAEKRADESFSDTVKRITSEVAADWRHSLGKYSEHAEAFEAAVQRSREATNRGLARRQQDAIDRLDAVEQSDDERDR